jgi:DNA-binding MarR family transcriptional regulator
VSRHSSRFELAQQLRNEILGYFGAASDFDERLAKKLKLSQTDVRCLDLIGRLGPMTAGKLAEESGLTTGAVTFILDRLEEAGMVTRRRDTEDRRRVWVEIVPEARQRLEGLQQPIAEEMRELAQRYKAEDLAVVRDFMRQAKEVFQRQVKDAVKDSVRDAVRESVRSAHQAAQDAADEAARSVRESVRSARESARDSARAARESARDSSRAARDAARAARERERATSKGAAGEGEPPTEEPGGETE